MAFSGALFLITVFGMCHHACGANGKFWMKVGQAALDVFSFGTGLFNFFLPKNDDNGKTEILNKLDEVLTNINSLQKTVSDQFLEMKLLILLQKVEDFERATENRLRKAEDIVQASDAEKNNYISIFLDGMNDYLDDMDDLIPYVTESSFSSYKSILQLIQDKSDCHLRPIYDFNEYVRNLYMTGISIEIMYKKYKFNSSLTVEQPQWEEALKSFDSEANVIEQHCEEVNFQQRFREDVKKEYTSLKDFLKFFEQRYGRSFLILEVNDNEITVSNDRTHTFHCVHRNPDCNRKVCFLYHGQDTPCDDMIALQIKGIGLSYYIYEISEDFEAGFAVELVENLDFFLPSSCFMKTKYKFYKPSSEQITTICSSVQLVCSEICVIFIALFVFVFMVF